MASAAADESISNIRTVKAFADEKQSVDHYHDKSKNVYKLGKTKAFFYGGF